MGCGEKVTLRAPSHPVSSAKQPFITLFSAPKPFTDTNIDVIQRNAIQSWLHMGDDVQVLLIGDEPGMSQVAGEFRVTQLPDVKRNADGTPLVNSIFCLARQASQAPLLAYLNADMLITPDFISVARQVARQAEKFLLIGQRWDLDQRELLDFSPGWDERLQEQVRLQGQLHPPAGSDYFLFPRDLYQNMPDFAIGRAGWDNWMIYHARQQGWWVIDATPSLKVVHQNHDYSHLPGGKSHHELPESSRNLELAGGKANIYLVLDSNRQLRDGKIIQPPPSLGRIARRVELWLYRKPGKPQGLRLSLIRRMRRIRRADE
jgi:hypothetical protein